MLESQIVKKAILNAVGTVAYVIAVASFMFYVSKNFASIGGDTVFMPIAMLSLLVFSTALVGLLIFGQPILWYWDGRKSEAVSLITHTLTVFLILTILAFAAVFVVR